MMRCGPAAEPHPARPARRDHRPRPCPRVHRGRPRAPELRRDARPRPPAREGVAAARREARRQGCPLDEQPSGVAARRLRGDDARRHPRTDQHVVAGARARVRPRPLRRDDADHARALRRPGLSRHAGRARRSRVAAPPHARPRRHPRTRAGRALGPGRDRRRCRARRRAARRRSRRRGLHPLHVRHDVDAQGRPAPASRARREHVEHRRAPAPDRRRPHVDGHLALLELRLRERAAGRHDPWRHDRAAGIARRGRRTGADRARAVHGVLRHAQHRAGAHGASRPGAARPFVAADGRRHRSPARDADGDGARRPRDLQRVRPDRMLRQLHGHRRPRSRGRALRDGRLSAAGHGAPDRPSRDAASAAGG